jgi:hypothetical protein
MSVPISYPKEHEKLYKEICDYLKIPQQKEKLDRAREMLGLPPTDKESGSGSPSASGEATA